MLERGELSQVTANAELADRLMATARQHLASVRLLADSDPYLAYVAVYDGSGKPYPLCCRSRGSALRHLAGIWRSCTPCRRSSARRWAPSSAPSTGSG